MRRHRWCLKTDIVKFFPSIDHDILLETLRRSVADEQLMELVEKIVRSGKMLPDQQATLSYFPGDDLFAALRPRGLPIGNLTSQFFSNVYLDPIDHFIKEDLRIPGYVRYADDLLLFGDSKSKLWDTARSLSDRLASCRLRLHPEKTQVQPTAQAITFLGFRVGSEQLRMSQQGIRRFIRRTRRQRQEFARGEFSLGDVPVSLAAWRAHLRGTNSQAIQRVLIRQQLRFQRERDSEATS